MNYAVDYQPVEDSDVLAWENGQEPKHIVLSSGKGPKQKSIFSTGASKKRKSSQLAAKMQTIAFLDQLQPGDIVYTELGGQNNRFCLAAFQRGVKLLRLATWLVSDEQKRQRHKEYKVGDKVETVVSIIYRSAVSSPEKFFPFRDVEDERYSRVRLLTRMYWMVQRKIRMATANRLRHLQQDLEYFGGIKKLKAIHEAVETVLETLPPGEALSEGDDSEGGKAIKFYKNLEGRLKSALEVQLEELPLYRDVFAPLREAGCAEGISGYVISAILDIRRFPTFPKLKAFAGFHLVRSSNGWQAPRMKKGQRSNWDRMLKHGVWSFTQQVPLKKPDNPWLMQLERRFRYEVEKLLQKQKDQGKIPPEMTLDQFFATVEEIREEQRRRGIKEPQLPEPYKGIPILARKRAGRWIGQQFLGYVYSGWRRFEGLEHESFKFGV